LGLDIGLDVHKESISIAVAEEGREHGMVGGSLIALERALRKLKEPGTLGIVGGRFNRHLKLVRQYRRVL
jgi:hypothetical protein